MVVFGHRGLLAYDTPLNDRLNWTQRRLSRACQRIFFAPLLFCSLWLRIFLGKIFALCGLRSWKFGATMPTFERAVAFLLTFALFVLAALGPGQMFRQVSGPVLRVGSGRNSFWSFANIVFGIYAIARRLEPFAPFDSVTMSNLDSFIHFRLGVQCSKGGVGAS